MDEVQGEWELDELVDDLQNGWDKHDAAKKGKHSSKSKATNVSVLTEDRQQNTLFSPILEPVLNTENILPTNNQQGINAQPIR